MILVLIMMILRVLCGLANASVEETAFPLMCSLAFGLFLFKLCKDYLEMFVDLSKI